MPGRDGVIILCARQHQASRARSREDPDGAPASTMAVGLNALVAPSSVAFGWLRRVGGLVAKGGSFTGSDGSAKRSVQVDVVDDFVQVVKPVVGILVLKIRATSPHLVVCLGNVLPVRTRSVHV